ncbi:MAG TPA: GDSL-type esterase/lipase family protein [Candidatus Methylacidiphilales bacterium]|nr:GDSL-type esterase/lipase family protein [Candidatus Methylacidiphilales bacterium]
MRAFLLPAFAGFLFLPAAWTLGQKERNPAIIPAPRLDCLGYFQKNINDANRQSKIDLIFDGDSITNLWTTTGAKIWNNRYAKLNAFDFGISGDQTQNLLWRLRNGQVNGLHPKLVVLLIGTNNISNTPDQIAEGIKAILTEYRTRCPQATILLQGIFPRGHQPIDPFRAKIQTTNRIIASFADGNKIIYADFGDKFLQPDGVLSGEIMGDYLHPTEKGYQIWANAIQPTIDRFFPPKMGPVPSMNQK